MKKYVFKPYSKIFPELFLREKERIFSLVKTALAIEHVGSTAVPNLGGKGIIDIAIAVRRQDMESVSQQLQSLGYEFRPTFSTPDRFYFIIYLPDPEEGSRRYHVHLTYPENSEWRQFIGFRDYLRNHPEEVEEYAAMKRLAANDANHEGERYRKIKEPMFKKVSSLMAQRQDDLVSFYRDRLNLQKANFSRIEHDDAMVATVFKITQPNGTQLILKICSRTGDYLREAYFLDRFAGKLPVPRIIQLMQPEVGVHGAVLMEYLPGELLKIADLNCKLTYEIGSLLAHIHLDRVKGYGDLTQPDHLNSDPRVHFTIKFEEGMEECSNHLPASLLEKCRRYYDQHIDLLVGADGPCIIHRDFRPGNLIIHDGKLQGIIDWSSARGGFAEEDFCPLEFEEWPTNPSYKDSFLAGYGSVRKVPHYQRLMPLLRLSRAIATIGFTVKQEMWESKGAKIYQFNRQYLESFLKDIRP